MLKNSNKIDNPLVSIILITYNSSKYILDTLESIKGQTYHNVELIISDDCSTDNTVDICREFIEKNSNIEFIHQAKIVFTEKNSGIAINYNNGLRAASGEWIKYIAGDDMLVDNCIETFVSHALHSKDKLFVSDIFVLKNDAPLKEKKSNAEYFKGDAKSQFKTFVRHGLSLLFGPTIFINREILLKLGGFSEEYNMVEDVPIYLKFIKNEFRINLISKPLVIHRQYTESVSHSDDRFYNSVKLCYLNEVHKELCKRGMYMYYYHDLNTFLLSNPKYSFLHKTKISYLIKLLDPISYIDFYKKRKSSNKKSNT